MKKLVITLVALVCAATVNAQEFYGVGNRIGVGVGVGTEGIGIDAAVSLTKYVSVRAGVNFVPDFDITADADIEGLDQTISYGGQTMTIGEAYRSRFGKTMSDEIEAKLSLKRTTIDVKVDLYPFPGVSSFFICGGFSFGGKQVIKATGHSEAMADVAGLKNSSNPNDQRLYNAMQDAAGVDFDESLVKFDDNGDISATAEVKGFRPYLGLGFGRLIPKNRLGFRFELGAQFQGRPKILDIDGKDIVNDYGLSDGDKSDITKVLDYMKVYPVLKLSIRGRIL